MAVPPEEFLVSRRAPSLEDADFMCHRVKKSVSDLIAEGYDPKIVNDIPSYDQSEAEMNEERLARFSFDDDSVPPSEGRWTKQKSLD